MKPFLALLAGALLACFAACGDDNTVNGFNYLDYSYIDTVLAGDTIQNNQLVQIVYELPAGCNHFERFESAELRDTLEVSLLLHFYSTGVPCAHGPVVDTTSYRLLYVADGERWISYQRSKTEKIVQRVFVEP